MTDKPNILFIMADQLAAQALPPYGNTFVKAPNITRLFEESVVFDKAYCNFPICAPSRASMMSGRYASEIGTFDNGAEFAASIPTIPHYLSDLGYQTILSGKMHFVGPDQLHGYQERLTTDIYPGSFIWTPDWREGEHSKPSKISMRAVTEAGVCTRSLQMDYDDEVEFMAIRKLFDIARSDDERPFFLTASFTQPHSPYTITQAHWDMYPEKDVPLPDVAELPLEELDTLSRWLYYAHGRDLSTVTEQDVINARRGYFGMVTYLDEQVGRILKALDDTGMADNTVVVFASDHGEMLGERGMWYKQNFFEWSCRVPLAIRWPGNFKPRHSDAPASLIDLLPTLCDIASAGMPFEPVEPVAGKSLVPVLQGSEEGNGGRYVVSEYTAEGTRVPCRMVFDGRYKLIYVHGYQTQLFDLENDPLERDDIADKPEMREKVQQLMELVFENWDPDDINKRVLKSQQRRMFVQKVRALHDHEPSWNFQAFTDDSARYVREGAGSMDTTARARFPKVN